MLCVTMRDRIVRKTSPPDQHGAADVDERLVADEGEIPDREHRPRVPVPAPAEPDRPPRPDAGTEERTAAGELEVCAELARGADGDDLLAAHCRARADLDAVLEDDLRRDDERAFAENDVFADLSSVPPQGRDLVVGRESAKGIRVGAKRLEKVWVERPCLLVELERRGERDVLGGDTGEWRSSFRRGNRLLPGDEPLDVLLGDEAALLDRREIDSVPLCELGGLPGRLAIRRSRLRSSLLALRVLLEGRQLVGTLGDVGDRLAELDLDALTEELDDGSGARGFDLHGRFRRLDDTNRLSQRNLGPVLDEPLGKQGELRVRVLPRQDDLEHALLSHAFEGDDRLDDVVSARQHRLFERPRGGNDPVARRDALHGTA